MFDSFVHKYKGLEGSIGAHVYLVSNEIWMHHDLFNLYWQISSISQIIGIHSIMRSSYHVIK